MLYSFVDSQGNIVGQPKEFDTPPVLSAAKGRWLPDVVPPYNRSFYAVERIQPVATTATAIEYKLIPVPLDTARTVGCDIVNQKRTQTVVAGFTFNGKVIDSDHASAVNIIGAAVAAQIAHSQGLPFSITWTCADNTYITLDAMQMMQMMVDFAQYVSAQYDTARQRKDAINSASITTVDDIIALTS